jgi:hypothetical protein
MRKDTTPQGDWANSHIPKFNYFVGASGGTISKYTPSGWDKAQESSNFFVKLGYGVADGFYTYFQEMNPLNTHTMHLGHGFMTQNEKQDLAMVHASFIPIGKAGTILGNASKTLWNKFAEKLFLSEKFGITSKLFANKITGVQGTLNKPGGLFKIGWSNVSKKGGGMQLRIGVGSKTASPNQAWFHLYVPKTFVPNIYANPSIQVKRSLFNLTLKP